MIFRLFVSSRKARRQHSTSSGRSGCEPNEDAKPAYFVMFTLICHYLELLKLMREEGSGMEGSGRSVAGWTGWLCWLELTIVSFNARQ